ncbi:hypothetical protein [Paenibacillus medicaginis]|uniref:Uncharacterized protein n=1 Tax=Paenibacillus medicaginis TaxID=1470560 RepID=A0ABV5BUT8_9BACL
MKLYEKKELLEVLAQDYIYEKEQNKVWQREDGFYYGIALGKLLGACTAFKYELNVSNDVIKIYNRKQTVVEIELS